INACDTCHIVFLRSAGCRMPIADLPKSSISNSAISNFLSLPLLVFLVRADHAHDAAPPHDLALVADPPDRSPDLHSLSCPRFTAQPAEIAEKECSLRSRRARRLDRRLTPSQRSVHALHRRARAPT